MYQRVIDSVAGHYRHSDTLLFEDGVLLMGRVKEENEHTIWVDITGPVKKDKTDG